MSVFPQGLHGRGPWPQGTVDAVVSRDGAIIQSELPPSVFPISLPGRRKQKSSFAVDMSSSEVSCNGDQAEYGKC